MLVDIQCGDRHFNNVSIETSVNINPLGLTDYPLISALGIEGGEGISMSLGLTRQAAEGLMNGPSTVLGILSKTDSSVNPPVTASRLVSVTRPMNMIPADPGELV